MSRVFSSRQMIRPSFGLTLGFTLVLSLSACTRVSVMESLLSTTGSVTPEPSSTPLPSSTPTPSPAPSSGPPSGVSCIPTGPLPTYTEPPFDLSCGSCDVILDLATYDQDGVALGVGEGSVVCFKGQASAINQGFNFTNFVGSAAKPILIRNCERPLKISRDGSKSFLLSFNRSKYVRVSGYTTQDGAPGLILDGANNAIKANLTSDLEIDHVEVTHSSGIGINVKTDPTCNSETWRGNFTLRNVNIHHCKISDTGQEGIYLGNSHYSTYVTQTCSGVATQIYEHDVENANVYDNEIKRTGRDGIQIGAAVGGMTMLRNTVEDSCLNSPVGGTQDSLCGSGLQVNIGSRGTVAYNWVKGSSAHMAWGIQLHLHGSGATYVYNNVFIDHVAGGIMTKNYTISPSGMSWHVFNNTFLRPRDYGLYMLDTDTTGNRYYNNLIAGLMAGTRGFTKFTSKATGSDLTSENNYQSTSESDVLFQGLSALNLKLQSASPARDQGRAINSVSGLTLDFDFTSRVCGSIPDQGAFEFK